MCGRYGSRTLLGPLTRLTSLQPGLYTAPALAPAAAEPSGRLVAWELRRPGSRFGAADLPVGGDTGLAEVRVGENETFESALRRFNKKIQQSGILAEARRREHYEKPSVKRKRKEAKRKKAARSE